MEVAPRKLAKSIVIELAWLLGSWAFSFGAVNLMVGLPMLPSGVVDIQMHNTYFVMSTTVAALPFFLILASAITTLRLLAGARRNALTMGIAGTLSLCWLLVASGILVAFLANYRR